MINTIAAVKQSRTKQFQTSLAWPDRFFLLCGGGKNPVLTQKKKAVWPCKTTRIQTLMNIIKQTPYFPGFVLCHVLVACCLMMVRCTVESMICGYHKYISIQLFESELDLLKYCNIDIRTLILMQNKLKHTSRCYVYLVLQNRKISEKSWRIVVIHQICQSFFPSKVFYCTIHKFCRKSTTSN